MAVCSMGGAASTCCPCLEKQLTILERPDSVADLNFLFFSGCISIGQCSLDSYLKLFVQCGYGARANALLSAVGAPYPPPSSSLPPRLAAPPPPAVIPPVPQSIPSGWGDRAALLAQKNAITNQPSISALTSWTADGDPCGFTFVICDNGRVSVLNMPE
eukprot:jgi/Mesvir1/5557/Mv15583-RA.1